MKHQFLITYSKAFRKILFVTLYCLSFAPIILKAQCSDWNIAAANIQPSNCTASGSFSVTLSGADVTNLNNVQYSIPLSGNGFSVPPNNSSDFINVPPGTYNVTVSAVCNSSNVSKTTSVTIGGSYAAPSCVATLLRGSLNCGNYGQIQVLATGGNLPYTIQLVSVPAAYTGAHSFTSSSGAYIVDNLAPGTYTLQVVDACGTATAIQTVEVSSLDPASMPLSTSTISGSGNFCNVITISMPEIAYGAIADWNNYVTSLSLFQAACSIDGGATYTAYQPMSNYTGFTLTLPAGKTYKDYYGQTILFNIQPPCGAVFQTSTSLSAPYIGLSSIPHCAAGFQEGLGIYDELLCYPLTITLQNTGTNISYGPYSTSTGNFTTPILPYGDYTATFVTNDGYSATQSFSQADVSGTNPYFINIDADYQGLDNYIQGFSFSTIAGSFMNGTTITLLSGPAGYAYNMTVSGNPSNVFIEANMAPITSSNYYFAKGTYIWQIADSCHTYDFTLTADSSNVFVYTLNTDNKVKGCNGLIVYPTGAGFIDGIQQNVFFQILSGPAGYNNTPISAGGSFILPIPGTYVIGIGSSSYVNVYWNPLPNPYQVTQTIVYNPMPLAVDVNNTQGFVCIGASGSLGSIAIQGMNGIPFATPVPHYKYYIAAQGNGQSGPYLDSNNTGTFPSIGIAGSIFDLKIVDSCGAFVVQPVKILDLSTAILATANGSVFCAGDALDLSAIPMPNATYSWTGPNGFNSTDRTPVIPHVTTAYTGHYTVTITSTFCTTPATYGLDIVVNPSPDTAIINIACVNTTAVLTASNVAGAEYQWFDNNNPITGATNTIYTVTQPGIYKVCTIFTVSGCTTSSDSIVFTTVPNETPQPLITANATTICKGDTAQLLANCTATPTGYQWYLNGAPITGATNTIYNAGISGTYSVQITTGPCSFATSGSVVITQPVPQAYITTNMPVTFCQGDSVIFNANTGSGLSYIWFANGIPITGATDNNYAADTSGSYYVTVFNGICSNASAAIQVTVDSLSIADISPVGDITICAGQNMQLSTPAHANNFYTWLYNGTNIPGATSNNYNTSVAGSYAVIVSNGVCPADTSAIVSLFVILAPDTTLSISGPDHFCQGGSVTLSVPVSTGYIYTWYRNDMPIPGASSSAYTVLNSGDYSVSISNNTCTDTSHSETVTVYPAPVPVIKRSDLVLSTGDYSTYQWYFNALPISGATNQTCPIVQTGYYKVSVTNADGCIGMSDSFLVESLTEACIVRLPSAFSPNGDGKNDVFGLIGNDDFELFQFIVENRWGEAIFETLDRTRGWDGTFNGVPQETGTYFYYLKYRCADGSNMLEQSGNVTLIR